eukprot:scaffold65425_cov22-Tisochrysis_lutea.AAC.6
MVIISPRTSFPRPLYPTTGYGWLHLQPHTPNPTHLNEQTYLAPHLGMYAWLAPAEIGRHTKEGQPQVLYGARPCAKRLLQRRIKARAREHRQHGQREVRKQVAHAAHAACIILHSNLKTKEERGRETIKTQQTTYPDHEAFIVVHSDL